MVLSTKVVVALAGFFACQATTSASADDVDFSTYGYPYSHIAKGETGWVTWQADAASDSSTHDEFGSASECAAQCQIENATSGAWSDKYFFCWCYFIDVEYLCLEPCVEETYVDFLTWSVDELEYCETSVCDADKFYSKDYCEDTVGFDEASCDAKLAELGVGRDVPSSTGSTVASFTPEQSTTVPTATAAAEVTAAPTAKPSSVDNAEKSDSNACRSIDSRLICTTLLVIVVAS